MRRPAARILVLLSLAELLAMSVWFTGSAVGPELQEPWNLTASQVGWLTTVVQFGFVAGTAIAAVLNLADLIPSRLYFAGAALLAAASNALVPLAQEFPAALSLRFLTGFFLAGVYPPAMKMISTWFRRSRGLAIGTVVGALTVGKATPYLVKALPALGAGEVIWSASVAALAGGCLVFFLYRDGPYPFRREPFSWKLAPRVLAHRPTRLAIGGYLGHMWELYAMWTWAPVFLAASAAAMGGEATPAPGWVDVAAFGAIGWGGVGCVWGGWAADRIGRERVVSLALALSGTASLTVGLFFSGPFWLLVLLIWGWGFFVVADSAQFSALVTEVSPPESVGTALTLQTSLGFLLTMASIQLIPLTEAWVGWRWGFTILALGPVFGIGAATRLARLRSLPQKGAQRDLLSF